MHTERTPLLNDKQGTKRPSPCTLTLLVSTFVPSLAGFLIGYDQTVIESTLSLPNFQHHYFKPTSYVNPFDYLTSGFFSMAILGSLYSGTVCDQAGRKRALIGGLLMFVLGTLLDMGLSHSLVFLLGRCMTGFGVGMLRVASPCLTVELAPTELRACLVGFFTLMVKAGKLTGYYMMQAMDSPAPHTSSLGWSNDWRTPILVEASLGLLMAAIHWQLAESPRWLYQYDATLARHTIEHLQEQTLDSPTVQEEWIQMDGMTTTMGYRELLISSSQRYVLMGGAGLVLADWMTGYDTLVKNYAPEIFYVYELEQHSLAATGCISSLGLAATAISLGWCVDYFDRKRFLLFGCVIMLLCHLGLGSVFQWASLVDWQTGSLILMVQVRSLAITCVYLIIIAYSLTWGSVVLATICEWFTLENRAKALGLMMALGLATQWFQLVASPWYFWISPSLIYFIFALAMLVTACFVYRWVPNTTARLLDDTAL